MTHRFAPFQMEITDEDDYIITSASEEYLIWLKDQVENPDERTTESDLRSYRRQITAMEDFWDRYVKARDTASRN